MADENAGQPNLIDEEEMVVGVKTHTKSPGFERLSMTANPSRSTSTSTGSEDEATSYGTNYLLIPPRFFEYVVLRENYVTVRVVSYFLLEALVAPDPVTAEIEASAE